MPRHPAQVELKTGKGPRQRLWDAMRAKAGAEWDLYSLCRLASVDDETARDYIRGLVAAGSVAETRSERVSNVARTKYYRLIIDSGIDAPRVRRDGSPVTQGLAQEQMWRTLRVLKGDTCARELAAHASTAAVPVAESAAGDYLRNLHHAGYLQITAAARHGRRCGAAQARYRLISNTGPKPPMVCRTDAMFDPNLGETIWIRPVTEEDAIYARRTH